MSELDAIIYTDGGWRRTKDVGAWGCLVINPSNNRAVKLAEAVRDTTNNRMELLAVVKAFEVLKTPGKTVKVVSDSQYTINACSRWMPGWKANGWTKNTPGELKNVDILKQIDALISQHTTRFVWVRGHSGDRGNDFVDSLLNSAMDDLLKGGDGRIHGHIEQWES